MAPNQTTEFQRPLIVKCAKLNGEFSPIKMLAVVDLAAQQLRRFEELFHFARLCHQAETDLQHLSFVDKSVHFFSCVDSPFTADLVNRLGDQDWAVSDTPLAVSITSAVKTDHVLQQVHRDRSLGWVIRIDGCEELYTERLYWADLAELRSSIKEPPGTVRKSTPVSYADATR